MPERCVCLCYEPGWTSASSGWRLDNVDEPTTWMSVNMLHSRVQFSTARGSHEPPGWHCVAT